MRDAPYAGLYLALYEGAKPGVRALLPDAAVGQSGEGRAATNFASGGFAASLATALTNPPDAIKTRLQLRPEEYRNSWQCAGRMVREEGVRSLFDGLGLRVVRKGLSGAVGWTVYEEFIRRAGPWFERG